MSTTTFSRTDPGIPLQELQETVSRLSSHKGVESVLILNKRGDVIVQSGSLSTAATPPTAATSSGEEPNDTAGEQEQSTHRLFETATNYLHGLDPEDEVAFMQLRSKNNRELMIAPHEGFVLAVLKRT